MKNWGDKKEVLKAKYYHATNVVAMKFINFFEHIRETRESRKQLKKMEAQENNRICSKYKM